MDSKIGVELSKDSMHRLLQRQIKRFLTNSGAEPELIQFLQSVNDAYRQSDEDRALLERSNELSSKELVAANSEMRAVFNALPDLIVHLDYSGKVLNCFGGENCENALGEGKTLGTHIQSSPCEEISSSFSDGIEQLKREKSIHFFEYDLVIGGRKSSFEVRMIPVLEKIIIAVIRNVTQRKEFERRIRDAYEQTEDLLASISSILIGVDSRNIVTRWNAACEITFGIKSRDVLGKPLAEAGISWEWDKINGQINIVRNMGIHARMEDVSYVRNDGKEGFLFVTINPVLSESKYSSSGFVLLASEITERKLLESQLAQAQKLESIGQLASGIAHEINTPIQYIGDNTRFLESAFGDILTLLGRLETLFNAAQSGTLPERSIDHINSMMQEADLDFLKSEIPQAVSQSIEGIDRVTEIVLAMKNFSHMGMKEKILVDVNKAIEDTITVTRNEWKYVAEITTDFQKELPLVPCLPGELNQVVLNLIVNAVHAIESVKDRDEQNMITISTRVEGSYVELTVSDTGCGIPEKIRNKIFDPFFTTKAVGKGTGQGLAIAHDVVVKKHGGRIICESEVGKGTTFRVLLPLDEGPDLPANRSVTLVAEPCPQAISGTDVLT
jgi:PAS domain S-box-containing protein